MPERLALPPACLACGNVERGRDDRERRAAALGLLVRAVLPATLALSLVSLACAGKKSTESSTMIEPMPITDATRADLKSLESIRVFFAHQSVGGNILDGLASLSKDVGAGIKIQPLDGKPTGPGVVEASAGQNGHPDSKLRFFSEAMAKLGDQLPQIALVKFCFVDFNPHTDVEALFLDYQSHLAQLRRKYPDVVFVHVTSPLTVRPRGAKARLYRLLGRSVWEDDANVRRAAYNNRIRSTFRDEPVFDLARIESTRPDGTREDFMNRDGALTPALFPDYSLDGEHLNTRGRRLAAAEFAHVLATAAKNQKTMNP
jgi:hypothetical protein